MINRKGKPKKANLSGLCVVDSLNAYGKDKKLKKVFLLVIKVYTINYK